MSSLIKGSDVYSIPDGWSLTHPSLPGVKFIGRSPEEAVAELEARLRVQGIASTREKLWQYANAVWGRRVIAAGQADRWLGGELPAENPETAAGSEHMRRILTPRDYGGALWGTLHMIPLAVPWNQNAWMGHIALMTKLIEPGGYEQGCPHCSAHWHAFLASNPPSMVLNAWTAAEWSLRAHNSASSHAGHEQWTWLQAAEKWGWPGEWEFTK